MFVRRWRLLTNYVNGAWVWLDKWNLSLITSTLRLSPSGIVLFKLQWIRVWRLPFNLWNLDMFSAIGKICGGLESVDPKTINYDELQWVRLELEDGDPRCVPWLISIINSGHYFLVAITIEGDILIEGSPDCNYLDVNGIGVPLDSTLELFVGKVVEAHIRDTDFGARSYFKSEPAPAVVMTRRPTFNQIACENNPSSSGRGLEKTFRNMETLSNRQNGSVGNDGSHLHNTYTGGMESSQVAKKGKNLMHEYLIRVNHLAQPGHIMCRNEGFRFAGPR